MRCRWAIFDGRELPLFRLAREYTLADRFFHAAFGGALLNHFWLICACTPRYDNAPENLVAKLDADGRMIKDGAVTPDGYAVNTIDPISTPHDPTITDNRQFLPLQTMPTIGRRLTDAGVSWAWYSGGFADAVAGHPDSTFIYHHQPFAYFADYAAGTAGRSEHLKDEHDMMRAIRDRTLPAVSFYKPIGADNEHPGYANLVRGDYHAAAYHLPNPAKLHLGRCCDHRHLRREWWHLGPRGTTENRSLGAWHAGADDHHLPIRQAAFHRPYNLRYDCNTQIDRSTLGIDAPRRTRRARGRLNQRSAIELAATIAGSG